MNATRDCRGMVKRAFVREDGRWIEVGVYCPACKGFWPTLEAARSHRVADTSGR